MPDANHAIIYHVVIVVFGDVEDCCFVTVGSVGGVEDGCIATVVVLGSGGQEDGLAGEQTRG